MGRGGIRHRHARPVGSTPPDPDSRDYDDLVLDADPVLYLILDGTAAGLLDQSGRAHHGTVVGTVTSEAGPGDGRNTVRFSGGVGNYIRVPDHPDLSVPTTGVLTIEGWYSQKVLEFTNVEGSGYVQPAGKLQYDGRCEWEVRLYSLTTPGEDPPRPNRWSGYAFNPPCGLGTGSYFQDPVTVDEWVHVVVVINMNVTSAQYPTGSIKIYKNGILRDQDALSNYNVVPQRTTSPLHIGSASLDSWFNGRIGRFAIYNYELAPTEIRTHYRNLVPAVPGSIDLARHVGSFAAASAGTTMQVTVGASGVPAGNSLICKVAHAYTASGPTMSDNRGNTYTRDRTTPSDGNVTRASIFSCPITTPLLAGDVITVTIPASAANRLCTIDEYEDIALVAPLQEADSDSDTNTGPSTGTAPIATTAVADALVIGVMAVSGPTSDTYTDDTVRDYASLTRVGVTDLTLNSAWKSINAAGDQIYVPALGTSRLWVQLIAIYKAGPGQPPPSTYDAEVLAAGPRMYLTLDGTADGLVDQTGRGHDATATGSPTAGTGIGDGKGSLAFDSSGTQYLTVADHDELSVTATGVLAVEAWVSPAVLNFPHEQGDDYVYFAGKAGTGQNEWQCRMYSLDTPGLDPPRPQRMSIYVNNLSGGFGAGSYVQAPVAVDQWVHYVGIIDSRPHAVYGAQGYTRIYRDGVLINTDDILSWNITPENGTAPVRIGTSALGSFFQGRIAKFAIWDYEPSAAQIQSRYAKAAPPAPPAPTGTAEFQAHIGDATDTASGTTTTVTLSAGVPVGHTLIVHAAGDYTGAAPTVSDSRGNTYTRDRTGADGSNTMRANTFSARITSAMSAGDTITVTWPSAVGRRAVAINSWTKLAYPTVVDANNGGTNTGTSPTVSTPTTYGDTLLTAAVFAIGPTTDVFTEDTARQWTSLARVGTSGGSAGTDRTINAAYRAVPASGTYQYNPTLGTSRTYVTQIVAYRASSSTPPPPPDGGGAEHVKNLDAAHSASTGTTLVLTMGAAETSARPESRTATNAGLKVATSSLISPTLPRTGMSGSGTVRNIVASGTYENFDFPGAVNILANNVTLKNCRWLNPSDFWAVQCQGPTGVVIEDCLFDGATVGCDVWGTTVRRCEFKNMRDDPFHIGSASGTGGPQVIEDCLVYDYRLGLDKHGDGVQQWVSGIDDLYIRRCWFETKFAADYVDPGGDTGFTSPVFLQSYPEAGTQGMTLIADCVLDTESNYAIRFEGPGSAHGAITCRPVALRNRLRASSETPLIEGGVPFEGEGNVDWAGTAYNHPSQIAPGSGIPDEGGGGGGGSVVVPVGHTVVVQVVADYTAAGPAAVDSRGNTYTVDRTSADAATGVRTSILSAPITTALMDGDTITITVGGATAVTRRAAIADEFSGVLVPTVVDRQNGRAGTSTSPSVTLTTANPVDLLVAAVGVAGPSTDAFTEAGQWTGLTPRGTSGASPATLDRTLHSAWRSVSAVGPYTYAPQLGTSRGWVAALVAYKAVEAVVLSILSFGAIGDDSTDNTVAFTAAAAAAAPASMPYGTAAAVYVPPGIFKTGPFISDQRVLWFGDGFTSVIKLKDNAGVGAALITNRQNYSGGNDAQGVQIRNLRLHGNRGAQLPGSWNSGIVLRNDTPSGSYEWVDGRHQISNVLIEQFTGTGIVQTGRGAAQISDVQVFDCDGHGMNLGVDCEVTSCDVGAIGLDGFLSQGNSTFSNCKAWFCGAYLTSSRYEGTPATAVTRDAPAGMPWEGSDITGGLVYSLTNGFGNGFHFIDIGGTSVVGNYAGGTATGIIGQDCARAGIRIAGGRHTLVGVEADSNSNAGTVDGTAGGAQLGSYAGVEIVGPPIYSGNNMVTGFSWDRSANLSHQVAALQLDDFAGPNQIDLNFGGSLKDGTNMPPLRAGSVVTGSSLRFQSAGLSSIATPSYAASWSPDPYVAETHSMTLTGSTTVGAPALAGTNTGSGIFLIPGMRLTLKFTQDATGNRGITLNAVYKLNRFGFSYAANSVSAVTFVWDGTSWQAVAGSSPQPSTWEAADSGYFTWSYDVASAAGAAAPLATAGTIYTIRLHNPTAHSVTNIVTYLSAAGSGLTSGQCFAALFRADTGALLGTTADQATAWASTGLKTMAIAGGPVTAPAGDLIVGLWFNGTTGPSPFRSNGVALVNAGLSAANSRFGTADTGRTTSAPSTLATLSAANIAYWAALS